MRAARVIPGVVLGLALASSLAGCQRLDFGPDPLAQPAASSTVGASGAPQPSRPATSSLKPPKSGLPKAFPKDFPVYVGNMVAAGTATAPGKDTVLSFRVLTADPADTVKSFYLAEPTKTGWKVLDRGAVAMPGGREAYLIEVGKGVHTGFVRISSVNGLTTIEANLIVLK